MRLKPSIYCGWKFRKVAYLFRSDWLLAGLVKLFNSLLVVAKILLAANEDDWKALAEVEHFRNPLWFAHISISLSCSESAKNRDGLPFPERYQVNRASQPQSR
jgi:hypothetical protein